MTGPTTWLSNTAGAVPHSFIKVKLVENQVVEEYSVSHYPRCLPLNFLDELTITEIGCAAGAHFGFQRTD